MQAAGPTGLLNDTGQTQCYNALNLAGVCDATTTGDAGALPRQDGRFGRDPASTVPGTLTKVGAGDAGFDFTKVCMDGTPNCAMPANTSANPAATDWACTKDNVTNLVWSLQIQLATWITATVSTYPDAGHNSVTRCGFNSGWRLPTRRELLSIVNYDGRNPSVDSNYFPTTPVNLFWTNDPYQTTSNAWQVSFIDGYSNAYPTTTPLFIRLVRSGQ